MMMKVVVERRKLIKPLMATPSELSSYKISIIDELNPSMHVIRILYYPSSSSDSAAGKLSIINLEESLARILPLFYPLAGRYIKEKHMVDCNDEGAEFSVASVDCDLVTVTGGGGGSSAAEQLNHLLPLEIGAADEPTDPMLAVQINKFRCGGVAIGVCASHRISDSASLGIFLTAWADAAAGRNSVVIKPDFDSPEFFPSENLPPLDFGVSRTRDTSVVCDRFLLDKDAISILRDTACPDWRSTVAGGGRPPSRVVVVSTVLTQALLRADRAKNGGVSRASLIAQAINVRERTIPPVAKHAWGTWVSLSYLEHNAEETNHSLEPDEYPGLARKMRETTMQGVKDCPRILSDKQFGRWVLVDSYFDAAKKASSPDYKVIWITDWSKFGEYELDFGFGKPVWVSLADVPLQDLFILMNTKDNDGIEAWVYLHESDMPFFQNEYEDIVKTMLIADPKTHANKLCNYHLPRVVVR